MPSRGSSRTAADPSQRRLGRLSRSALLVALAGALGLAGCGGFSSQPGGVTGSASARTITIQTDPAGVARYVQTRALAHAGLVHITLSNPSPIAHSLHLTGHGVDADTAIITQASATLTVRLRPGTYTYFCDVPGHVHMRGTLTVR